MTDGICVGVHMQRLSLMPTVDIAQHANTHGLLAGKSAADTLAVAAANLRQEHPLVVASADAHADLAEGCMCITNA